MFLCRKSKYLTWRILMIISFMPQDCNNIKFDGSQYRLIHVYGSLIYQSITHPGPGWYFADLLLVAPYNQNAPIGCSWDEYLPSWENIPRPLAPAPPALTHIQQPESSFLGLKLFRGWSITSRIKLLNDIIWSITRKIKFVNDIIFLQLSTANQSHLLVFSSLEQSKMCVLRADKLLRVIQLCI